MPNYTSRKIEELKELQKKDVVFNIEYINFLRTALEEQKAEVVKEIWQKLRFAQSKDEFNYKKDVIKILMDLDPQPKGEPNN